MALATLPCQDYETVATQGEETNITCPKLLAESAICQIIPDVQFCYLTLLKLSHSS